MLVGEGGGRLGTLVDGYRGVAYPPFRAGQAINELRYVGWGLVPAPRNVLIRRISAAHASYQSSRRSSDRERTFSGTSRLAAAAANSSASQRSPFATSSVKPSPK